MNQFRPRPFANIPPVIKNLLIINILMFFGTMLLGGALDSQQKIYDILGLHYIKSSLFQPFQIVTHMFMHANLTHIFLNMFMLWMFGRVLEQVWGGKRLLFYYLFTGLGAAALHMLVMHIEFQAAVNKLATLHNLPTAEVFAVLLERGDLDVVTVGASGAVFGVLLAFGMMFPNMPLVLIFFPFYPIKAKYMVIGMGVIELVEGLSRSGGNVAHFAHLGGMLFGFLLIRYWKTNNHNLY